MCLLNLILLFSEFSHFKYLCFLFSWHLLILFKKSLTATWRWRSVWSGRSSCDLPFKTSMSKVASSSRLAASRLVSLIFAFDLNLFYCRWAGTRKVKPIWILLKQETVSGISWATCKSAPCSRQIDNHTSTPSLKVFTGRMPFLPPNQQRQSRLPQRTCCCLNWTELVLLMNRRDDFIST